MKKLGSLLFNGIAVPVKFIAVTFFIFSLLGSPAHAATLTSTGVTTNWSSSTTWSGGGIGATPAAGDVIIIATGTSVTLNTSSASLGTVTVNGTLEFQAGTARTLTCTNLTISSTGIFRTNASGTVGGHLLSLSGNLTNNGTLDFYTNGGTANASITFTGSSNNTFSGTGATTDIYSITINKGTTPTYMVDLTVSNFLVRGVNTDVAGFLTLSNGTFKISGTFTMTNRVFTSAGYTIAANTGFYLNNPNFTVAAQVGSVNWYGTVTLGAGTFNVGTSSDDNVFYSGSAATYIINGGALNIAGSMQPYYDASNYTYYVDYTQTGGTVTCCTVGNTFGGPTGKGYPSMWITEYSAFTMSGGTIVIRGQNILWNYDFDCSATTRSITGGTLQIGDASSGTAKRYGITGYFPNIVITNTSGNHSAEFYKIASSPYPYVYLTTTLQSNTTLDANTNSMGATFVGDITMNAGSTFDAGTVSHVVKGNWINHGTLTYRTSDFTFSGTSTQTISGSADLDFYDLILNNSNGLVLSSDAGVVNSIQHALTFTSGKITLNNTDLDFEAAYDGTSSGIYGSYGSTNYIITNGTGVFRRYMIGSASGRRTTALFPIGISASSYTPVTLNVTSTTTTDNFSARVSQGVYSGGTTGTLYSTNTVNRTWNVSEGTAGGSNVTLTFQWPSTIETTSFNRNSCYVGHYKNGAWSLSSSTAASGSNPYTRTSGTLTSFSPFSVASGISLPIELLNFDAKANGDKVEANWATASEHNNDFFTLERSADGVTFEKIKNIPGAGNSERVLKYEETDDSPLKGVSYYRLKQTDFDGQSSYSQIVPVEFNSNTNASVVYNTTEQNSASLSYNLLSNSLVTVEIIDVSGKLVAVLFENEYQYFGSHKQALHFEASPGIYYAKIIVNGTPTTCKFVH
ncbi:MAG TPA: G8 domain-containing protein [Bacteroidia bacterium]|nr:G8 domain-containing protein [Bacteroidia bacterium]